MRWRCAEARTWPEVAWVNAIIFMPPLAAITPCWSDTVYVRLAGSAEGVQSFRRANGCEDGGC